MESVFITPPPQGLENAFQELFTEDALHFITALVTTFEERVEEMHRRRGERQCAIDRGAIPVLPRIPSEGNNWKIAPLPLRLQNRHIDLGDVSPANEDHFVQALNSNVQAVQTDLDDGHCPSWSNQLRGLHNMCRFVWGTLPNAPSIQSAPIMMMRPRAWNMVEKNIMINGRQIPGALCDFGLLLFHLGNRLHQSEAGPFMYLSKLESSFEAELWNDIFIWTQQQIGLPIGTIKACVLIENILAAFEMDQILYALRQHSLGLNCGIWDYVASVIHKFGHNKNFLIPDRKHINMTNHFLRSYMALLVHTCHTRGAPATCGMAAQVVTDDNEKLVVENVCKAKLFEIHHNVDGFLIYDTKLIPSMEKLWEKYGHSGSGKYESKQFSMTSGDLLQIPPGFITLAGVRQNIAVALLYIQSWMNGKGHFCFQGQVEDSATAEISRTQLWQWIRQQVHLQDVNQIVTPSLVRNEIARAVLELGSNSQQLHECGDILIKIVTARQPPNFITTFLYDYGVV